MKMVKELLDRQFLQKTSSGAVTYYLNQHYKYDTNVTKYYAFNGSGSPCRAVTP